MSTVCVETSLVNHSGCMQYTIISEMFSAVCCLADFTEKSETIHSSHSRDTSEEFGAWMSSFCLLPPPSTP